jgi:hypothetical protein
MTLDSKYFAAFSFEEIILDKDSAFPLANGLVYFYKDKARTELKDIFQLVGAPTYSYVSLPNPIKLSSIGSFQDASGNDIVPYFYPYDAAGKVELYYVTFYSSADGITPDVFQFDREAVPSAAVAAGGEEVSEAKNYIPDGQFLLHTDIPATDITDPGELVSDITILSQGGWSFERSTGATSKDVIQFNAITSAVSNPTGNPKFTCNSICYIPDINASYKSLRLKFNDVNKFASDTQYYTLAFYAKSNAGAPNMDINLIKNFGTGGSPDPSTSTPIGAVDQLTASFAIYNFSFQFGTNIGKTLGTNGDDYLQIEFSFPASSAYDIEIVDVALVSGSTVLTGFPLMANDEMIGRSLAGWADVPAYDGSNLYLPLILTPQGISYDTSQIGKIEATYSGTLGKGELWADGVKYKTSDRSSDGIPYSRLQSVLWYPACRVPMAGTGSNWVTAMTRDGTSSTSNCLVIANNTAGIAAAAANGAVSTGFYIAQICSGAATYLVTSYMEAANSFFIESNSAGSATISSGTSGFAVYDNYYGHDGSISGLRNIAVVVPVAPAGLAGKYFTFQPGGGGAYYVWYKVDLVGTDPAPGGYGIEVDLSASDSVTAAAIKTTAALNAHQTTFVVTIAASSVPAGSWFTMHTPSGSLYVWYKKDGVGTDPAVSGYVGVLVDILSSDSAINVALKTQIAINSTYFAVPDLRGMFLRGRGGSFNGKDTYAYLRYTMIPGIWGDIWGGYEIDVNLAHIHGATSGLSQFRVVTWNGGTKGATGGGPDWAENTVSVSTTIAQDGGWEVVPKNVAVNYIIKY